MSSTCKMCLPSKPIPAMHDKIMDRVSQPTPEAVREAWEEAGFTQAKAAELVSPAKKAGYKTWGAYELSADNPNRRVIRSLHRSFSCLRF